MSNLSKLYANLMSILGQNAITKSVLFLHGFDRSTPFEQC